MLLHCSNRFVCTVTTIVFTTAKWNTARLRFRPRESSNEKKYCSILKDLCSAR